jgi:chemosensory pili system protein ChpE
VISLFAAAFVLGLIFNAAPGAVFAESVKQNLCGGYQAALRVQLGSLLGDAVWAVLGLAGVGALLQWEAVRWPLGVASVAYLAWLAMDAWRCAIRCRRNRPCWMAQISSQFVMRWNAEMLSWKNNQWPALLCSSR